MNEPDPLAGGADKALELSMVSVRYGQVCALQEVSLTLGRGTVCALVGVNGSGKSTLFKTVMGLVRPVSGQVRIDDRPPGQARRAGLVGYVPQAEAVDWTFPLLVREVVMTGRYGRLGLTRRPGRADQDAVDQALERVHLADLQHRQIGHLSGGQRKRAFVARALAQGARVILLDEPFAGVDAGSAQTMRGVLRELAGAGATVLVSTHDLQSVPDLADEAVLLMRRVLAHGSVEQVIRPEMLALAFGLDSAGPVGQL